MQRLYDYVHPINNNRGSDTLSTIKIKHWLIKGLLIAIIAQLSYLFLLNLALNIPLTQTLINQIKPEKFQIHWQNAWTWYPFRVHASGVSVHGQSSSQQWQVELQSASASIALLPLLQRKVKVYDIQGIDIEYYQRPVPTADKDFSKLAQYFPTMKAGNSEVDQAAKAAKTDKKKDKKKERCRKFISCTFLFFPRRFLLILSDTPNAVAQ